MATTQNEHNGNGSTRRFSFTFPYIKEDDVKVSLRTSTANVTTIASANYTFPSATEIQFSAVTETDFQESTGAPKTGVTVRVFRDTDLDTERVTFFPGSSIRAQDLNDNTLQNLYASQERQNRAVDSTGGTMTGDLLMLQSDIRFEGATADDHETTLTVTDPTADRTITLPNQSGTVPVLAASSNTQITATPEELNTLDGITSTVAELNIMDGVTATTAELNTMDGITATTAELNLMDGVTATTAELNLLDGVTATTAELNLVDGVTATTAEINTLDGVTSTAAELNLLDGVTSTTAELNILDGVTATAAEINILDGVTSTAAELNLLDGRSVSGATISTNTTTQENELPTTEAVVAYVTDQLDQVEGFVAIATENDFPNTQPPEGVAVSIGNVGGLSVDQNGQATNAERADGTAVTITGIEENFRPTSGTRDVADGVRFIVISSATANQYTYHKATLKEADLINLSTDIEDFGNRYRVSGTEPDTGLDNGDLWWDTANDQLNAYDGAAWSPVTASGEFIRLLLRDTDGTAPTFDGSVRDYNLVREDDTSVAGSITTAQQLLLSVDGVMQRPNPGTTIATTGNGFCRVDADTIQLAGAPEAGAQVFAIQMGTATEINTPAEDSVDSQHYVDDSIDSQHLNSTNGSEAVTSDVIRDDAVTDDKLADSTDTDADRAVGTNHIKDGNVTQAKIADEAINEARLQVSNAPTNGFFLSAQSGNTGGLTWAEVPQTNLDAAITINESGNDVDFRVESDDNINMLFVDGGEDRVGIGTGTPEYTLDVTGTDAVALPAGTDAQRPGSLDANDTGLLRYSTTSGRFEYWSTTSTTPQWRRVTQDPVVNITATGGTTSTSGDNTIHTFTSSGTFEITEGGGDVTYLVVAGGGGGGGNNGNEDAVGGSGGGGAGGLLTGTLENLGVGEYTITVGAGGAGGDASNSGTDGGNSSIVANSITNVVATGGGGGGWGGNSTSAAIDGRDGGSGGGGGSRSSGESSGGSGTTGQGNDGGTGGAGDAGGGGGGAGGTGGNWSGSTAGDGGDGTASSITGTSVTYAGGGGGAAGGGESTGGAGGSGGGGAGAIRNTSDAGDGTDGRGSGGGAATDSSQASESVGGDGGNGVVILSYAS